MATPQLEDGYTRIANELMEALIKYRIPGEQMQCLLLIIRKTYGFNKIWDMISNSQFVEFTGLKKGNVCRALRSLIGKNIVIKKDNINTPSYCFNKEYKTWKVLSTKIIVIKSDNAVIKSDNAVIKSDNKLLSKVMDTKERKDNITKDIYVDISKKVLEKINSLSGKNFCDYDPILAVLMSKKFTPKITEEDCLKVVNFKWKDEFIKNGYFTPASLFRITKFKSKLDEANNTGPVKESKQPKIIKAGDESILSNG